MATSAETATDAGYPGKRFGLPESGVGSVASMGARVGAFLLDLVLSFLVAWIFTHPALPENWSLVVWGAMTVLTVAAFGVTPGHAAFGIRVVSTRRRYAVGLWAVPRTALVFLLLPPLLVDADGRGLHDRLCRTAVVRMR